MNRKTHRSFIAVGVALLVIVASVSGVFAASYGFSGNIASGPQYDLYTVPLIAGEVVTATLTCDFDGVSRPLDPVLSAFFPGSDPSNTSFADVYNDDSFGSDDEPNGIDCDAFDSSRVQFTAPVTGDYVIRADGFGSATGPYTLNIVTGTGNPLSLDGRINPHAHAPVVLYCAGTSTNVYSVTGALLGTVADGESATLGSAQISPTADGRMQLNAPLADGKGYLFVWDGCPSGNSVTFTLENGTQVQFAAESYNANGVK